MFFRARSTVLAGTGAMLLVLSLSGVVAAASILTAIAAPVADPAQPAAEVDTTATFEDINGDGIDDDCQTDVVEVPGAGDAAKAAIDLNADGQISVSEAAQSGWTGGKNCNHGGYVSSVAHEQGCDATEPVETPADESGTGEVVPVVAVVTTTVATCTTETTADEASAAAKAAARAEKDAAKAAAKAARLAAKEARIAAREARAAERAAAKAAAKAAKVHGKAHKG